jgi:hypothetical protein
MPTRAIFFFSLFFFLWALVTMREALGGSARIPQRLHVHLVSQPKSAPQTAVLTQNEGGGHENAPLAPNQQFSPHFKPMSQSISPNGTFSAETHKKGYLPVLGLGVILLVAMVSAYFFWRKKQLEQEEEW